VCALFDPEVREAVLGTDQDAVDRTGRTQPAMFALEVALFRLVESWGVRPDFLLGHSIGELAAAHLAGVFTLPDACALIAARGRLMDALPEGGAMLAVRATEEEIQDSLGDTVSLAAVNGPRSVVVSGDEDAVEAVALAWRDRDVKRLRVSHAFHSHRMAPMLADFRAVAARITYHPATVPVVSNVSGRLAGAEIGTPEYWVRHVRAAVRFADGVGELIGHGVRTFLELGPDGVLSGMGQECLTGDEDVALVPTLRRDRPETESVLTALSRVHVRGVPVDWRAVAGDGPRRVDLPTYAFQRERFWLDPDDGPRDATGLGLGSADHPLLGAAIGLAGTDTALLTGRISASSQPWLGDHVVFGATVVPGTALLDLAVRAADETACDRVEELVLEAPLVLPDRGGVQVQVAVGARDETGRRSITVHSRREEDPWTRNASGTLTTAADADAGADLDLAQWPPSGAEPLPVDGLYASLAELGISYGPTFRGVRAAWRAGDVLYAEVRLPDGVDTDGYGVHPALLDAALHALGLTGTGGARLPFTWSDVDVLAAGATALRVRLEPSGADAVSVRVADESGALVASVGRLGLRPAGAGDLTTTAGSVFRVEWTAVPATGEPDLVEIDALAPDVPAPDHVVARYSGDATARVLDLLQTWLAEDRYEHSTLVVVTSGALAASGHDAVSDLAASPVWGLVRSAQSEHPGRFVLVDTDDTTGPALLAAAVGTGEPQVAVRSGELLVPRLVRGGAALVPPRGPHWRLGTPAPGTIDALDLVPAEDAGRALAPGEVRIAVRAAGLNFRDVLITLGMYPGDADMGIEGAGTVLETGPGVTGFAVGDRVTGLVDGAFGPVAVADHRLLTTIPAGWSFARAASVPVAFLTAYHGLVDLAGVRAGERVLVHAGAGGVGMAAVQLARHLGAEVYATASPAKWDTLRSLGLDDAHIASSRTLDFEAAFLSSTDGRGVDVVLDSLAGEFVDATLRLLPRGGRFVEMGKIDIRDRDEVAAAHPGVRYQAFDLIEAGQERLREMLAELMNLFADDALTPLPVSAFDVRRAKEAVRHVSQTRHVGKVVLTLAPPADTALTGTVLITGGTGALGRRVAEHLAGRGARKLVLASRSGPAAPGAGDLVSELTGPDTEVVVAACDVADRDAVASVVAEHGITAVVHAAGVLDDGTVESLTPDRLAEVMRPKADAAMALHEATLHLDLDAFVLFSSAAATLGGPGQANYAAANAFLDALAQRRRAQGLPAQSLAWGPWEEGMAAGLSDAEIRRMVLTPLSIMDGRALLDACADSDSAVVLPMTLSMPAIRAGHTPLPPMLGDLAATVTRRVVGPATTGSAPGGELRGLSAEDRDHALLDLVATNVAAVLGRRTAGLDVRQAFKDMGFDSLTAVELRNRLAAATGLRLPTTLVFDHPSAELLVRHLAGELGAPATTSVHVMSTRADDDPIVIVAMSCRYPGGVQGPEDLWRLVADGRDAISDLPADRGWDLDALYDTDPERPGTSYVRQGGFLHDAADFDAEFFGISPREAAAMDPQQRLLLEVSWEVFERAGIDPTSLRGSRTGVFAGTDSHDYSILVHRSADQAEGYLVTGTAASVMSGRVAYSFGLEGPALTVDTACSSSLVALHLACQSLRRDECTLAVAGGVAVMATPSGFVEFSRQRGLAPDGRCKPFAAAADGTAWGEGVGVLLLERLSDATRLGHPVLAVLRGSAVNSDGASNGLTAPNGPAQQRVIRAALADGGLVAADVDVVEAHGTGTTLGDPIEAQAVLSTYGQDRVVPVLLGSIKSNIGHTTAAAGVAGVIKMVMAMRHGLLPATLHVDEPTPHVDWSAGAVRLLTEPTAWSPNGHPRRAGVSSFGVSGTNAHVIVEEPGQEAAARVAPAETPAVLPLVLSARGADALRAQAARLLSFVESAPGLAPADVGLSLLGKARLADRAVVVGTGRESLVEGLRALAAGHGSVTGHVLAGRVAMVFPGQGAQWAGMGRELLASSKVFAARMADCAQALSPYVDWSLTDVIADEAALDRVDVVQPVLWAVMVSLAEVWRSFGVTPAAVVGHSQGEIAAACVAGALSLADGAKVVALRARELTVLAGLGGMVSVGLPADEVARLCGAGVGVAAENGPRSTVVSGDPAGLDRLVTECERRGVRIRRLPVDYASHSAHVDAVRERLGAALADLEPALPRVPFLSTVTGDWIDADTPLDGDYWYRNLREPVRFGAAVRRLLGQGWSTFVEASPHPVLTGGIQESIDDAEADAGVDAVAIATLRRDDGGLPRLAESLAEAHVHGVAVDWSSFFAASGARRIDLPTYAFQHRRYWLDAPSSQGDPGAAGLTATGHPLVGTALTVADGRELLLTGRLSTRSQPWLADHTVGDSLVVPGAALVELALRAGAESGCPTLGELTLETPLVLAGAVRVQVKVDEPDDRGDRRVGIHSQVSDEPWTRHADGVLTAATGTPPPVSWPPADAEEIPLEGWYDALAAAGLGYGPTFQGVRRAWRHGGDTYAEVALPDGTGVDGYLLHPALVDAAVQTCGLGRTPDEFGLPFAWTDVRAHATGATRLTVRLTQRGESFSLLAVDATGEPVLTVGSITLRRPTAGTARRAESLYEVAWRPVAAQGQPKGRVFVPSGDGGIVELGTARHTIGGDDALTATSEALALLRGWLADESTSDGKLVIPTRRAVATGPEVDLGGAAVWGLVRSAQSEHPDRFVLVDVDGLDESWAALPSAVATGEPQLVVRAGAVSVPRLVRAAPAEPLPAPFDADSTVLVTGGTGTLGRLVAHHLADRYGVAKLVLVSRGGAALDGDLPATAVVESCDVADRTELRALLGRQRITAVVHAAGVLDDGTVESLTEKRLASVLRAKADSARLLDELTGELTAFVLFSSAVGTLGGPGQANYAAANAYLDGLAARRRAHGRPATSLAWGLWETPTGMTGALGDADRARIRADGIVALPVREGLDLFDAAVTDARPHLVPVRLDTAALRARADGLAPLLSALVPVSLRRADSERDPAGLAGRLVGRQQAEQERLLLDLVRDGVCAVLGHASPEAVAPGRAFKDLGFDSLTAVRLRNRLATATGHKLPATLVFDHPTPAALARFLRAELLGDDADIPVATVAGDAGTDPVVIVGMGCRFPGGVRSADDLWRLVAGGVDAIGDFPADRGWDLDRLHHPDPDHPGTFYPTAGGFLDGAADFDPEFFGISPREALAMDPQQRVLLETAWEAFEHAGIVPESVRGTRTGVYVGAMSQDYGTAADEAPEVVEGYQLTGIAGSVVSGRLAYTFGLEGPAVTVDTACSSSLVALHLATRALRSGECTMALVGGVTVMSSPGAFIEFSRQRGLAPDGRCKAFSDDADGTGWAEGAGVLLVERLSDARRLGHRPLAIVRGSAVNSDGASNGLSAPNGPAQQRVIRQALADAGLEPEQVDAVEAHGTGTVLGDPIEVQALTRTYGRDRPAGRPLWLGTVKSNIGHAQAAAGVAGIVKMVQAMRHGTLPATLHAEDPTSEVDWSAGTVELLTASRDWPDSDAPRRAGVSSFGISGTNAHVVLEGIPRPERDTEPTAAVITPWLVSATDAESLPAQAARLSLAVADRHPADVGYSLATRAALPHRAVVLGREQADLRRGLTALASGEPAANVVRGTVTDGSLAFLFTGQGAQRVGMGLELAAAFPVFADALDEVCGALDEHLDRPLRDVLAADATTLDQTEYAQPALFAVETALFRLLSSFGLRPSHLLGHSIGEITAAHVAGVLSLPDTARLVAARGRLMQALPAGGAMVSIKASEDEVLPTLGDRVDLAAVNGPSSVVVSGAEEAVLAVADEWRARGHETRRLRVSHAFHSRLLDPMLAEFRVVAESLSYSAPRLPIVSTVTGLVADDELRDRDHWVDQVRGAVRFADGVSTLHDAGARTFLEVGPDGVLTAMARDCLTGDHATVPALRANRSEVESLGLALAQVHVHGREVDWPAFFAGTGAGHVDLPTYGFRRRRFWLGSTSPRRMAQAGQNGIDHPLLGARIALAADDGVLLTGRLAPSVRPWLTQHRVLGTAILPGTVFVDLALRAGAEVGCPRVEELVVEAPLPVPDRAGLQIQVSVGGLGADGRRTVAVHAREEATDEPWVRHVTGTLAADVPHPAAELTDWPPPGAEEIPVADRYDRLAEAGLDYGPEFRGLVRAWRGGDELFAEVALPSGDAEGFGLHPALLDAVLHVAAGDEVRLPFAWSGISLFSTGATTLRARLRPAPGDAVSLALADGVGRPVAEIAALTSRPAAPGTRGPERSLFRVDWTPVTVADADTAGDLELWRGDDPAEALEQCRRWLAEGRPDARLVVLTKDMATNPASAGVWGLVRSAQLEHPGRFVLVDTDTDDVPTTLVNSAVASGEPQLTIRGTEVLVPRLVRDVAVDQDTIPWRPDDTVLITGGTGALGQLVARHLVTEHGVGHVVLASRRGFTGEVPGELTDAGARITVVPCDLADRDAVAALLAAHPVTAVIHAAGVLDDGTVDSLSPERLATVWRSKVDSAVHLAELAGDLRAFVLFSSVAGTLGSAGQANYAAANAALDALARRRVAAGQPAVSLAWGPWDTDGGMLGRTGRPRLRRAGAEAMSPADALRLLDIAVTTSVPAVVAARLDLPTLRDNGIRLAGTPVRRATASPAGPQPRTPEQTTAMVVAEAAAVLGYPSADQVDVDRAFRDLGFDSLTAVDLRNRLEAATGLRLPATLVFDHPTVSALAGHLVGVKDPAAEVRSAVATDEPIAIVAMSCRYPGGVRTPEDLWRLVVAGGDAIAEFPADRGWDHDTLYDPDPSHTGTTTVWRGGFLHDAADFDADFFGMGPREAIATDPQQRLLLETAWEAFERAGLDPNSLRGSRTGVFAGVMYNDYATRLHSIPDEVEGYLGNGSAGSVASGRVAYTFGLQGPAVTVDTACSSSLVALHLAAQSLRQGECSLALVGGVTVMSSPTAFVEFSRQRGLAPDGRCKSFGDGADGTGWAEGAGMLLVERLSDARSNGHEVLAVVRGSAVNSDGASNGLTAPNGPAQQRVIRAALASAGLTPADVDTVEAHGTGTVLGDPIEAQALIATYGQDRDRPLWLGSVKSNIGHTQAAAGVAGVIKVVMAMRAGILPPTLHAEEPSTRIDWAAGNVRLVHDAAEWRDRAGARRAAVSSFGVSGTNAHVVLEHLAEKPAAAPRVAPAVLPLVLSAKTAAALREQATHVRSFVDDPDVDPVDVAFTALGRSTFDHRAVVVGGDRHTLSAGLDLLAGDAPGPVTGRPVAGGLAFLFTGQGAQRPGMGAELYEGLPVFAAAFDEVCAHLAPEVRAAVFDDDPDALAATGLAQPALFAVEVALFRLFESWGVRPDVLVGHSVGELVAAHVAGILSLPDACRLVTARADLMSALPTGGAMAAVQATEDEVLDAMPDGVSVAAVNGPASTVLSGDEDGVAAAMAHWRSSGRKVTRLRVSHAFHSHRMEPMLAEFRAVAEELTYREPSVPIVSTVSGSVTEDEMRDPGYWVRQVRASVRFADAVRCAADRGARTFLELGPDAVLTAMGQDCLDGDHDFVPALRANSPEHRTAVTAVARLHVRGVPVDWHAMFAGTGARRIVLPTYPFQRERYWLTAPAGVADVASAGLGAGEHPLVGAMVTAPDGDGFVLTGKLSTATHPWLADHVVAGTVLLPGAAFAELALHAAELAGCDRVEDLVVEAPMVLPARGGVVFQLTVDAPGGDDRRKLRLHSRVGDGGPWTRNASGVVGSGTTWPTSSAEWPPSDAVQLDLAGLYDDLAAVGLDYGPAFRCATAAWRHGEDVLAEVALPDAADAKRYGLHPALLDAALHVTAFARGGKQASVPFQWTGVSLRAAVGATARVRVTPRGADELTVTFADGTGTPVARVESLSLRPLPRNLIGGDALFQVEWLRTPATQPERDLVEVSDPADVAALATTARTAVLTVTETDLHAATHRVLAVCQAWLAAEDTSSRLVVATRGAVAALPGDDPANLAGAAVWGLVRSAQSEHPDRFGLVDVDDPALLPSAIGAGLPQVAGRAGELFEPRLTRLEPHGEQVWHPDDTVLITGGTGSLGARVARHLVTAHDVRRLVLASRSGPDASGAADLAAELTSQGVEVAVVACDLADRAAVAALLTAHPVTAVVHAAGVLDDGVLTALTPDRLDTVLSAKADAALHLHELSGDLSAFVLFSSAAGLTGAPGQGNYAAANAVLDALAQHRRATGLPATSLAWGLWEQDDGGMGDLADTDRRRLGRSGVTPLSGEEALALFDAATGGPALAVPIRLDLAALRGHEVPPLVRSLVRDTRRSATTVSLADRLASVSDGDRLRVLREFVRGEVAAVLGHTSAAAITPDRTFGDLGFDSLAAVELRNRMTAASGLRLPATLIFDHPTTEALVSYLDERVRDDTEISVLPLLAEMDRLAGGLAAIQADDDARTRVAVRLRELLAGLDAGAVAAAGAVSAGEAVSRFETASDDEIFDFIDNELGAS
ncbi:SDR family NAD(P)-dependent oxidoreductase, partial [Actinophytocola sp.]|uniref:SDR family NAD(P)-dependent oxidoreductase n=1 Tax=Actinophytocola sp. TaxID=1872138 RepID=UPI0039C879C4